jgi:hypothetical protein
MLMCSRAAGMGPCNYEASRLYNLHGGVFLTPPYKLYPVYTNHPVFGGFRPNLSSKNFLEFLKEAKNQAVMELTCRIHTTIVLIA